MYTASGFLICDLKKKQPIAKADVTEKFMICPAGTWKRKCTLECDSGIMTGACRGEQNKIHAITGFDMEECTGKDIYFDMVSKNLKC
jgi:hypothetical protein